MQYGKVTDTFIATNVVCALPISSQYKFNDTSVSSKQYSMTQFRRMGELAFFGVVQICDHLQIPV